MKQPIVDFTIDTTGTAVTLTANSFHVIQDDQNVEIDVDLQPYHSSNCSAIDCMTVSFKDGCNEKLPSIFVASSCAVSSWHAKNNNNSTVYYLQSKVAMTDIKAVNRSAHLYPDHPTQLYVSSSKSSLSLCVGDMISIFAIASNLGLAHYVDLKHDMKVVDLTLLTFKGSPTCMVTTGDNGDISIWNIPRQICVKTLKKNISPCTVDRSSYLFNSLLTSQMDQTQCRCYVAYTSMDELHLFSFKVKDERIGGTVTDIDIDNITLIYHLNDSLPLALSFINDGNRMCIVVTSKDICVIDCLQKCVIKRLCSDSNHTIQRWSDEPFSKGRISFPFVGVLKKNQSSVIKYKMDSVFALVGAMSQDTLIKQQNPQFQPLLMDDKIVLDWIEKTGQQKCLHEKDCNLKVKSSGYGASQPNMRLGCGLATVKQEQHQKAVKLKRIQKLREKKRANTSYPLECASLDCHQDQHDDKETPCLLPPISSMAFDTYGDFLATAHKNNLHIMRLPFSKYKSASHQISGTSHPCSVEKEKIDTSCRISWSCNASKKYIAFHNKIYRLSSNAKSLSEVMKLGEDATNTAFFSRDLCILYNKGNTLSIQRFQQEDIENNSKSGGTLPVKKIIRSDTKGNTFNSFTFDDAKRITSIASVNGSMANLIGCACSDKTLQIVDLTQNKVLWSKKECAGSRAAHCVSFPQPSKNISLSPENYNFLIASSTDNGGLLTLFDLRCGEIVKQFRGHVNRRDVCMTSFSPCLRYVAVGSEGFCSTAALYDLRKGTHPMNTKLGYDKQNNLFRDGTVTDCQFNPIYPQLVTGSLNGKLRWYSERQI